MGGVGKNSKIQLSHLRVSHLVHDLPPWRFRPVGIPGVLSRAHLVLYSSIYMILSDDWVFDGGLNRSWDALVISPTYLKCYSRGHPVHPLTLIRRNGQS